MARAAVPGGEQNVRRRVRLEGRVQMVGFRAFATLHARRLALLGWVRNTPEGEVELLAEGPPDAMTEFLTLLQRGPAAAEVTSFHTFEDSSAAELGDFEPLP